MAWRSKGRPLFNLKTSKKNEIIAWLKREKPLWRARCENRNYHLTALAYMFKLSRKTMKEVVEELANEHIDDDIKIELIQRIFHYRTGECRLETWGVHINPPGSNDEGNWLLVPMLRTTIEDMITLALRGELLRHWNNRPRLLPLGNLR